MVKLPEGTKVYVGTKVYKGEIPDSLLPSKSKFREKSKVISDGGKHKGTSGE